MKSVPNKRSSGLPKKGNIVKAIKEFPATRIDAAELFSHFTASIIKNKTVFTR